MRAKASRCPALSVTATHPSTARLRASSSAAAAARWPRASLTGPGCSRSLFLEPEADLHRHLEGRILARMETAPDLGHLEPVHVPQSLLGPAQGDADGVLNAVAGGADYLGNSVNVVAHECSEWVRASLAGA